VEELPAEVAELARRLEEAREDLSRLEIMRGTGTWVLAVLAVLAAAEAGPDVAAWGLRLGGSGGGWAGVWFLAAGAVSGAGGGSWSTR
jgi:hypothetical protein